MKKIVLLMALILPLFSFNQFKEELYKLEINEDEDNFLYQLKNIIYLKKIKSTKYNSNIYKIVKIKKSKKKKNSQKRKNNLLIFIDLKKKRMLIFLNKGVIYNWNIESSKKGYTTPTGKFQPTWLDEKHYSSQYNNKEMPYSIFFKDGYAIHGGGTKKSHGCITLSTKNAAILFRLIEALGKENCLIEIKK